MNDKYKTNLGYNASKPKHTQMSNSIERTRKNNRINPNSHGIMGMGHSRRSTQTTNSTNSEDEINNSEIKTKQSKQENVVETAYDIANKARVTIKIAKVSIPIIITLIGLFGIVSFLFIFICVVLPGAGFFDSEEDITTQSGHIAYLSTINSNCKSLVVEGESISLDDYVANVVANEIGNDAPFEAKKALAIATRTFVIKNTNSCKQEVPSTEESFLLYNKNIKPNQDTIKAVEETKAQIMFDNNLLINAQYDNYCTIEETRSDGTGGFDCDTTNCYVTYGKISSSKDISSWEHHVVKVPISYKNKLTGGNCYGMSKVAAVYMASMGNNYENILKTFYDSEMVIESFEQTNGLEVTNIPNYLARTSRATRDNPYYYNQSSGLSANGLEGECAWYGLCRAKEILGTSGSSKTFPYGGNGGQYCEIAQSFEDPFPISTDITKPKEGSLVVWKGGTSGYGHVAVIEKIIDENTVFISEASIGNGAFGRTATDLLWTSGSGYNATNAKYGSNTLARKANCEGNDSGCQHFRKISLSALGNYGGLNFACYVYLLDN